MTMYIGNNVYFMLYIYHLVSLKWRFNQSIAALALPPNALSLNPRRPRCLF